MNYAIIRRCLAAFAGSGLALGVLAGCGGDARVELSAADTLDRMAQEVESAFREYHAEVAKGDDRREMRLTSDFLARVRRDVKNDKLLDQHAADFVNALGKVRQDREVEGQRHAAVLDHVQLMREVSTGLREVGLQNLYLDQEVRQYFDEALKRIAVAKPRSASLTSNSQTETNAG